MSISLERIYYTAMRKYNLKLIAGKAGIWSAVSWIHIVEDAQVASFLKGQELVVITGINSPNEEDLWEFTQKVYEYEAIGIIFNLGPFIKEVPERITAFAEEHGLPVFTMPWEVHLVEFNREFCDLIIRSEQEDQTLCSAYRNAIFSPKEEDGYLPILRNEGISVNEKYCMIKCMPKIERTGGEEIDFTRIFYELRLHFERIMNRTQKKYVIFRYDNCMTTIIPDTDKTEVEKIASEYLTFAKWKGVKGELYLATSKCNLKIASLSENFDSLSYMCKLCEKNGQRIWYGDDLGEWEMIFSVKDKSILKAFKKNTIGELEEIDQENGTDYCRILDTYLTLNGNMPDVAAELFIHRNTVAYHLKKIQELIHCDIYSTKDRVRLYLALRIKEILEL